jgi:hypothetical protein
MTSLSDLSVDELADGICLRAGRIAAAQAELLLWIAEFDRRQGWAGPGLLSCAHWLVWRIGLSPGAAREHVRVARRLQELPEVAVAFADGGVSYSTVRAITRVAEPGDGVDWVALARLGSARQLEKIVRGVRRAQPNQTAETDPEQAAWKVRTRKRYDACRGRSRWNVVGGRGASGRPRSQDPGLGLAAGNDPSAGPGGDGRSGGPLARHRSGADRRAPGVPHGTPTHLTFPRDRRTSRGPPTATRCSRWPSRRWPPSSRRIPTSHDAAGRS